MVRDYTARPGCVHIRQRVFKVQLKSDRGWAGTVRGALAGRDNQLYGNTEMDLIIFQNGDHYQLQASRIVNQKDQP